MYSFNTKGRYDCFNVANIPFVIMCCHFLLSVLHLPYKMHVNLSELILGHHTSDIPCNACKFKMSSFLVIHLSNVPCNACELKKGSFLVIHSSDVPQDTHKFMRAHFLYKNIFSDNF